MPYILKEFDSIKNKKIEDFLCEDIKLDNKLISKLLEKTKIFDEKGKIFQKNQKIKSKKVKLSLFEAQTKGLIPLFQTEHFAIFDKPSGIKVHPSSTDIGEYTLLDEIRYYLGNKAQFINRIDKETSGLVLVSKNDYAQFLFKEIFEDKKVVKKYLAWIDKKLENRQIIDKNLALSSGLIKIKMDICENGKESKTVISPIYYNSEKNQTLIEAEPITGRQHQIRAHLNSISHPIIGDPIYGLDEKIADKILKNQIDEKDRIKYTKASRLLLHSYYLEFKFLGIKYKIVSKQDFK